MAVEKITNKQGTLFKMKKGDSRALTDRFLVPPFSVFDTKQGYWQERKHDWLNLGIKSEVGRGDNLTFNLGCFNYEDEKERQQDKSKFGKCLPESIGDKYGRKVQATSIFDPVLCEIVYRWFSLEGWRIIDPFAGGSVRGIVASYLKRNYRGIDLRQEQIDANYTNYEEIKDKLIDRDGVEYRPDWICGNSVNVGIIDPEAKYDLIFSCPPYYDLEVYSDDPSDLSNKETYADFLRVYKLIIQNCVRHLNDNRFAVFVVGDIRDKNGIYRNFVGDTVRAFIEAGMQYYNEGILVNVAGTLPVRINKQFNSGRKFGKMHQNILVFYKGDTSKIKDIFGEVII